MSDRWSSPLRVAQFLLRDTDARTEDPEQLVAAAAEWGANAILLNAGGFSAWYPTALPFQRRNPWLQGDFLGAAVEAAHRRNMRFLARMDVSKTHPEIAAYHPEWLRYTADGTPSNEWEMPETCFTGAYWQECNFSILDEVLSLYAVDGLFYNMYRVAHCHCERCQRAVRAEGLTSIPLRADPADAEWRAYEVWRRRELVGYTRRLRVSLHDVRPDAALLVYHHQKEGWDVPGIADASDLVSVTASSPLAVNPVSPQPYWVNWPAYEAELGRGLRPERPAMVVTTTSALFASRRAAQPQDRLRASMLQIAFGRGAVCPATPGGLDQDDPRALPVVRETLGFLAAHEDVLDPLESIARVAVLASRDTLDFCPAPGSGHRSRQEEWGVHLALEQHRYPFDVVPLAAGRLDLQQYRVAIAPDVACLDSADAAAIDAWVSHGGTLIATGLTGAFTAHGELRPHNPLRALGHGRAGTLRDAAGAYLSVDDATLQEALGGARLIGVDGTFVDMSWDEPPAVQHLFLLGPVANNTPEFANVPTERGAAGLLGWTLGSGRGWLLPWWPGVLASHNGLPDPARLLAWLLEQTLGPAPIGITGNPAITARLWRQRARQRAVLMLLNEAARQTMPLIQHVPIGPLDVYVDMHCSAAHAVRADEEVPIRSVGSRTFLTLRSLGPFEVITLDGVE
ncbi:MAG: hypothetical protein NVSMB2_13800 [Chloroflexota bacterium]